MGIRPPWNRENSGTLKHHGFAARDGNGADALSFHRLQIFAASGPTVSCPDHDLDYDIESHDFDTTRQYGRSTSYFHTTGAVSQPSGLSAASEPVPHHRH